MFKPKPKDPLNEAASKFQAQTAAKPKKPAKHEKCPLCGQAEMGSAPAAMSPKEDDAG